MGCPAYFFAYFSNKSTSCTDSPPTFYYKLVRVDGSVTKKEVRCGKIREQFVHLLSELQKKSNEDFEDYAD